MLDCISKNARENRAYLKYLGLVLFLFSNIFNLVLQLSFLSTKWSPATIRNLNVSEEIIFIYIITMACLIFGFAFCGYVYPVRALNNKSSGMSFDNLSLIKLVKLTTLLLFTFLVLTQYSLGYANIFNLWAGHVRGPEVELAIKNSLFGVHSFLLILIFLSLILWMASAQVKLNKDPWVLAMLVLSVLSSLSQGKVQLLFYFSVAYLLQQTVSVKLAYKTIATGLCILVIFFITRLLRNQGIGLGFSGDDFLTFTVGLYLGSPFINTSYILDHLSSMKSCWEFFIHMFPSRFFVHTQLYEQLPDISSPNGFVGNGLLLGSYSALCVYSFFIGFFIHYLYLRSFNSIAIKLFYPFLMSACLLSFLYDHFTNLMFFWIPMMLSFLVANYISLKNSKTQS